MLLFSAHTISIFFVIRNHVVWLTNSLAKMPLSQDKLKWSLLTPPCITDKATASLPRTHTPPPFNTESRGFTSSGAGESGPLKISCDESSQCIFNVPNADGHLTGFAVRRRPRLSSSTSVFSDITSSRRSQASP